MATKVFMEALSPTMEEGRLVKWLKNEGDAVKNGETLAEVETDKAIMELVARGDGVLRKRLVNEGDAKAVGTLIGIIAGADENIDALVGEAGGASAAPAKPAEQPAAAAPAPAPAPAAAPQPQAQPQQTNVAAPIAIATWPSVRLASTSPKVQRRSAQPRIRYMIPSGPATNASAEMRLPSAPPTASPTNSALLVDGACAHRSAAYNAGTVIAAQAMSVVASPA